MPIAPQGKPAQLDQLNPTLTPGFYSPVMDSNFQGVLSNTSPAALEYSSANADLAVPATATATVGGTITNGDSFTVTLTNNVFQLGGFTNGAKTVTIAIVTADSTTTVAEKLAKAINDDADFRRYGIFADAAGAVVTIKQPGPVGNFTGVTEVDGSTITCTLSAATLSSGSGPVRILNNFEFMVNGTVQYFRYGQVLNLTYDVVAALVNGYMPIS